MVLVTKDKLLLKVAELNEYSKYLRCCLKDMVNLDILNNIKNKVVVL